MAKSRSVSTMTRCRYRSACSLLVLFMLSPSLAPPAQAAPLSPNERFADVIGQPVTTKDRSFRQHLVRLLDQSDRDRQRGLPESIWRKNREQAVLDVLRRSESQEFAIKSAFSGLLSREPTASELKSFHQVVNSTDTRAAIQRIASSDEYFRGAGGSSNKGFLAAIYRDIPKREIDPATEAQIESRLNSGVSRSTIVSQLLAGQEYRQRLVRDLYRSRGLGEPDPGKLADGLALLNNGDGYQRLIARVLTSDAYFQLSTRPAPATMGPAGGGLPLPPEISLGTGWSVVPTVPPGDLSTRAVATAPDGTLWRAGDDGFFVYDPLHGSWSSQIPLQSQLTFVQSLAPASATQAWVVAEGALVLVNTNGSVTSPSGPPECPSATCFQMVSATALSSRGVLWALSNLNNVYTFNPSAPSGQQWMLIPSGGYQITLVSGVGAANGGIAAYALAGSQALQYGSGGWSPVSFLAGTPVDWVQGCADGSAWALADVAGARLAQIRPGGQWSVVLKQTPPSTNVSRWFYQSAASQNRLYAVFEPSDLTSFRGVYSALSIGLVDQPPTPFPPMTAGQQAAYNAISLGLGVTIAGGVRAQYTNAAAPFSDWFTQVTTNQIQKPPAVSQTDWNAMTKQIATELKYVGEIYALFNQGIVPLNEQIQIVASPLLPAAAQVVGLTTPADQQASVGLFFLQMFSNVLSDVVGSFGVPGAIAGGVLGSILTAAVNALYPQVTPQNPLVQAYAQLATNISNTFQETDALAGQYLTTIVQDWGMLSTIGSLIDSGQWQWDYTQATAIALATENGFEVSFYQALFPAKWQVVNTLYGDYVQFPWDVTPGYDTYQVPCPSCNQYAFPVEYVWFANLLNGSTNLNGNLTPYPQQIFFDTLGGLEVDFDDFWRSHDGWTTKQVPATLN